MKRPGAMSRALKAAVEKARQEIDVVVDERETASENERIACMIILACGNDGDAEAQTYAWAARLLARRLPELTAQLDEANELLDTLDALRVEEIRQLNELLVLADNMWNAVPWIRAGDDRSYQPVNAYEFARAEHSRAAQLKEIE